LARHDDVLALRTFKRGVDELAAEAATGQRSQVIANGRRPGVAQLVWSDIASKQRQGRLAGQIQRVLKLGEDAHEQVVHASQAPRLVRGEVMPARDEQAQLDVEFRLGCDHAQIAARAHLIGNDASITRIALGLSADGALAGAVDRQARYMHQAQAGIEQHGLRERGNAAEHVDAHASRLRQAAQFIDQSVQFLGSVEQLAVQQDGAHSVHGAHPVNLLGDIDANEGGHEASPSRSKRQPFRAVYALHSDGSQSLISGRKGRAERGEMPPEPSRAASMKAIPSRRLASILACHTRHRSLGIEKGRAA
jgi:hypothetical protein